jgi:membrane-bound serine protease (ClpP class)
MKLLASVILSILCLAPIAIGAAPEAAGAVFVVPVRTDISSAQFFFLRRALKEAERAKASALVLHVDTYGGEVTAAIDSMEALLKTKVPTYTYIDSKAISAGALITLATQKIYMSPTAVIGAAAPVQSGGEDLPKAMSDKMVSALSAIARGAAQKCGHNPDLADAFIRKEAELKLGSEVLDKSDTLLTLDAKQATRAFDGKPLLAAGTANSLEEMLKAAGLSGPVHRVEPTGFEQLAFWLTTLAPLLLLGGLIGAYLEFKSPGFGLPGILSVTCFTLFFAAQYGAGLSGWEVMVLFVIGLLLVLSELFLHPGTVLPGVVGVLLMLASLLFAMVDRYPHQPWLPTTAMLIRPLVTLTLALLGACVAMFFLGKYLPRSSFFRWIVLSETTPHGAGPLLPEAFASVLTGAVGVARTTLRPSGKADFGGRMLDVVSHGEYIDPGQPVRVVAVEGARVVVEAARVPVEGSRA